MPSRPCRPRPEGLDARALLSAVPAIVSHSAEVVPAGIAQVGFDATFEDPAGTSGPVEVVVDWGDGTHTTPPVSTIDYVTGATGDNHGIRATHEYLGGGIYTITATILDPSGAVGQVTSTATVPDPYYSTPPAPAAMTAPVLPLDQVVAPFGSGNNDTATAEVIGLSNAILGHAPDAATLSADVDALETGTSVGVLASQMLHFNAYEDDLVSSYYQTYLGRTGSESEIAAWVARMQAGMTPEQVAAGFLDSAEFDADHPDDDSFILALYEDVLDRAPAPTEIAAWADALGPGLGRTAVVADFLGSPEAARRSVEVFYQAFLGRPADAPGLAVNAGLLESGMSQAEVASAIAGSAEFARLAGDSVG